MDYWTNELYHHGILGQKWGIRRYQNPDGTLTPAGRERYGNRLGEHASEVATSSWRRTLTGDSIGGINRSRGKKEEKLRLKRDKAIQSGDVDKARKLDAQYEGVKEGNIARDVYFSKMANGEIAAKRLLLRDGTGLMGRSNAELARVFNTPEINKKVEEILKYNDTNSEEARLAILMYGKRK